MRAKVLHPSADTIAAIATAQGRGGVGVVRISGRNVQMLAKAILGGLPLPRHATLANFQNEKGDVMDQGIALFFPSPNSYTGEDVLELQGHGGPAVLQMLLQQCVDLGARLAHPGEFTQRAFLNDKIDLAQAESVADLIEANTTEAAKSAIRSLRGDFSAAIRELVDELIHLRMLVEAMLDFPDEEVDAIDFKRREALLNSVRSKLQITLDTAKQGSLLREGVTDRYCRAAKRREVEFVEPLGWRRRGAGQRYSGHDPRCNSSGDTDTRGPTTYPGYRGTA